MRSPRPPLALLVGVVALVALALANTAEIRARAEAALAAGMPARETELARGFVLGEDDRIDPATVEDFRRSGLSHLLAVSGQNVALLAMLAMPLLAALGVPMRTRLVWILGLIAIYVPLAGAGPSIVRAGVMGGLSVLATLAGRRASRLYAVVIAAIVTLAVDPAFAADVGWQLSFAAVLGILLLAPSLRQALAARLGSGGLRGALADAAAMTIAATLATAPLIAHHFGAVSTTTLAANLLALPAVAPAMWLGMLAAAAGQLPGFPVELINGLNAPLLAYVAQVATWCGRPSWSYLNLRIGGGGLLASYAVLVGGALVGPWLARRRRISRPQRQEKPNRRRRRLGPVAAVALAGLVLTWALPAYGGGSAAPGPPVGLRVSVLDVGQGDAILLQPGSAPAILVDGGPPDGELRGKLRAAGVERIGAAVLTHDQADHAGGIAELLGRMPVEQLLYGLVDRGSVDRARAAGVPTRRIAAGSVVRSGRMRLEVLWPPAELLSESTVPGEEIVPAEDPNRLSVVLAVRWRDFSMLLTGDAEAAEVPLDPGPIDVLKVAHHGSDDAGLGRLLDRSKPTLALISVGAGNPFGHPTPRTLASLALRGIPTLRTDRDGTIVLDVRRDRLDVSLGR